LAGEKSTAKDDHSRLRFITPHARIITFCADEAPFLTVVGAAVDVVGDAAGQEEPGVDGGGVEVAIEINPLAAIVGPRLAAIGLANAVGEEGLFDLFEVFAGHGIIRPHAGRLRQLSGRFLRQESAPRIL
jgi:hypothetical protein